jgi:hypothetical protein
VREVQQRLAPRCVTHLREVEAAVAAAAEQEAVVGSAWLPFAGSSQPPLFRTVQPRKWRWWWRWREDGGRRYGSKLR